MVSKLVMGIIHNPFLVYVLPKKTVIPLYLTMLPMFINVPSYLVLHNLTTDTREWDVSPSMICPSFACFESKGRSNPHGYVDCTWAPSVSDICSGFIVGSIWVMGTSVTKN